MIYGYLRVSTGNQTVENQRNAIQKYATQNKTKIYKWVDETISSRKPLNKRLLFQLLNTIEPDSKIIITEISRLGRNLYELAMILQTAIDKSVEVISIKEGYTFKNDLLSKIMSYTFSIASEIERTHISSRIKMALDKLKAQNVQLGRPLGSKSQKLWSEENQQKIQELLDIGISKSQIARNLEVDRSTLIRFLNKSGIKAQTIS